jgi:citrate lyase subunit beta/citryl-CoA lyase
MLQNLDVFNADCVIVDLEDSVIEYEKDAARILIHHLLTQNNYPNIDVFVRLNDIETPHFVEDLHYLNTVDVSGYVLPKASIQALQECSKHTDKPFIPIIESPRAVLDARELASHPQVIGLLLGAEDLTKELNIDRTKQGHEIEYTRSHIAMVCHAYQIEAIDTPWIHKDDEDGLYRDTHHAKSLGFTAKSCIHPNHVSTINTVFTPSKKDILQAKRIVQKASEHGKGAFSLDGKMVDAPIIEKAKKLLKKAQKYNAL